MRISAVCVFALASLAVTLRNPRWTKFPLHGVPTAVYAYIVFACRQPVTTAR